MASCGNYVSVYTYVLFVRYSIFSPSLWFSVFIEYSFSIFQSYVLSYPALPVENSSFHCATVYLVHQFVLTVEISLVCFYCEYDMSLQK